MNERTWKYSIAEIPGEGLAVLRSQFGTQIFTRIKLRKLKISLCARCAKQLSTHAYRPITNSDNRMHRICVRCIEGEEQ